MRIDPSDAIRPHTHFEYRFKRQSKLMNNKPYIITLWAALLCFEYSESIKKYPIGIVTDLMLGIWKPTSTTY